MKTIIKFFLTISFFFLLGACDPSLVDEPPLGPTEATYFATTAEFRAKIASAYAAYYDWYHFAAPEFNFAGYVTSTFLLPGDDLTEANGDRTEVELFDGSLNPTQYRTGFIWKACYKAISRSNVVIDKVKTIDYSGYEGADEVTKIGGEARFLRAYAYFTLYNMFGSCPVITDRPQSIEDAQRSKNPASEVIGQVIDDAKDAIESLPESWDDVNKGRATKNSARGLLLKALVFRANYNNDNTADFEEAITVFNTMTASLTTNYIDNFSAFTENNEESLFEIQGSKAGAINNLFLHNDGPWRGVENLSIYRGYMMEPGGEGFNDATTKFLITEKLLTNHGTDPRISVFLNPEDGRGGLIFQKYNKPDGVNNFPPVNGGSSNNERLLRYAGSKLLVAEAMLKTGDPAEAIQQLNDIRKRARDWALAEGFGDGTIPADYDPAETNSATIMEWIMDERYIEHAGEGQRWWDLKRWHASGDVDLTGWGGGIEHFSTALSSPVQFDVNKHLLFPIPQEEINNNVNINENNPGY